MASFWENIGGLFGLKGPGQKRDLNMGQPISAIIPGFADLRKRIEQAQMGYGSDFVDRTTSPFVTSRQARFTEEEMPFISGEMSSRGLSRSSIAGQEIGRAGTRKERDINEMISQAVMQNLQQQKLDEASQRQMLYSLGIAEAAQQALAAQDEQKRRGIQIGYEQQADLGEQQGAARGVGLAAMLAAPFLPGAAGAAVAGIPGFMTGGGGGLFDLAENELRRRESAASQSSPFRGTTAFDVARARGNI